MSQTELRDHAKQILMAIAENNFEGKHLFMSALNKAGNGGRRTFLASVNTAPLKEYQNSEEEAMARVPMKSQNIQRRCACAEPRMILATDRFIAAKTVSEREKARKWARAWLALRRSLK